MVIFNPVLTNRKITIYLKYLIISFFSCFFYVCTIQWVPVKSRTTRVVPKAAILVQILLNLPQNFGPRPHVQIRETKPTWREDWQPLHGEQSAKHPLKWKHYKREKNRTLRGKPLQKAVTFTKPKCT